MSDIEITEVNQASSVRSTSNSFDLTQLKRIVEATLMASDKPMSVDKLHAMFELHEQPQKSDIRLVLEELQNDYLSRGIQLSKVASGYRFQTCLLYTSDAADE